MPEKYCLILLLFIFISCSNGSSEIAKTQEPFDPTYQLYSSVLDTYILGEKVDYKKLKENRANLDHFIYQLAGTTDDQLGEMSLNEQLAYWINAYNGITLRSIIDNYPVSSIREIDGVWKKTKWHVAEQEVTLDIIEHKILRPIYKDARIHFAVNCASIGCPPLLDKPFLGDSVHYQLDLVASQFVQNFKRHKIDFQENTIVTTEIFSWFSDDFIGTSKTIKFQNANDIENAVLNFTYTHLDDSLKTKTIKENQWDISFAPYDWTLNDTSSNIDSRK